MSESVLRVLVVGLSIVGWIIMNAYYYVWLSFYGLHHHSYTIVDLMIFVVFNVGLLQQLCGCEY